jgi:hypothetical protein
MAPPLVGGASSRMPPVAPGGPVPGGGASEQRGLAAQRDASTTPRQPASACSPNLLSRRRGGAGRQRRDVTVDELAALARALDVPPAGLWWASAAPVEHELLIHFQSEDELRLFLQGLDGLSEIGAKLRDSVPLAMSTPEEIKAFFSGPGTVLRTRRE